MVSNKDIENYFKAKRKHLYDGFKILQVNDCKRLGHDPWIINGIEKCHRCGLIIK